jgi:hypothetical protein
LAVLFTLTLFVSAFLLFLVQPMLARMVLPRLGGTPAVWNTCMVFFQALLLAGYAYSHATPAWLGARRQALIHVVILLLPLAMLPIAVSVDWSPPDSANPMAALLVLLFVTVGLPFFVVATSGPLLQRWFASTGHRQANDPYFLYAASNLGSMIALLGYPFLFEPRFGLSVQSRLWTAGYCLLVVLTAWCAALVWRRPPLQASGQESIPPLIRLSWRRRLHWVVLAFVPSSLMLSVTMYLTTDISSIPLLWVLPLSLYLLTFILAFARRRLVPLSVVFHLMPLVVLSIVMVLLSEATDPVFLLIAIHLLGLFWVGLACHGLLAEDRPPVGHLTEFYLWLSVGGVLGGLFNALVAPLIFNSIVEYPIVLVLACLLLRAKANRRPLEQAPSSRSMPEGAGASENILAGTPALTVPLRATPADGENGTAVAVAPAMATAIQTAVGMAPRPKVPRDEGESARRRGDIVFPLVLGAATAAAILLCQKVGVQPGPKSLALMFAVPVVVCYTFHERPLRFALGIAAVLLASNLYQGVLGKLEYRTRTFFGVHRVTLDPAGQYRVLVHGNTIHGKQSLDPDRRGKPLSYYYPTGPVGQLFAALQNDPRTNRVGIIGLGCGTMVAYAKPGQHWTYFEIDPAVARIAQDPNLFTFWHDAEAAGTHLDVVFGDARLTLEHTDEHFGLFVVDAFSSDAIPVHLLTREALRLYLDHLDKGGLLAINISNRYLDLEPVVAELANDSHLFCLLDDDRFTDNGEEQNGKTKSIWVVMARREGDIPRLRFQGGVWAPPSPRVALPVWTDDYSNIFKVFRTLRRGD